MGNILTVCIILAVVAGYSIAALWFGINGVTTIQLIDRFPLLFAPANFVYIITIIICLGFLYLAITAFKDRGTEHALTGLQCLFILAAGFLNINFFYTWHSEEYIPAIIMLILQLIVLFILYVTYPLKRETLMKRAPIALWFGWQLFMLFVVISYAAVYYEWNGFGLSGPLWVVIMLTICTAIALHLRYHHADVIVPSVIIWGYLGIIVNNGFDELFVSTASFFLIGVLLVGILFIHKNKKKTA